MMMISLSRMDLIYFFMGMKSVKMILIIDVIAGTLLKMMMLSKALMMMSMSRLVAVGGLAH